MCSYLTRLPGWEWCQGPLCQLQQALLFPWLPAQSWLLVFILLGGTRPKRSILLFSCQPSQSPNHLLLSRWFSHLKQVRQRQLEKDKPDRQQTTHVQKKPTLTRQLTHWCQAYNMRKSNPLASEEVQIQKEPSSDWKGKLLWSLWSMNIKASLQFS